MDEFGKRVGQFPAPGQQVSEYAPSSGVGGAAAKKHAARQDVFQAAYSTRPPDALDFIVDNALPGGGLPFFNVESEILSYTAPAGFLAVVTDIEWYITPQNAAIDPAQLSMKLLVDGSLLQGTDTMGIGQAGRLNGLYIPMKAGADLTVRLGRGPGAVRYVTTAFKQLRANGDPNGFTAFAEGGRANQIATLNGVLYVYSGGFIWRSYDGVSFTNIATPGFTALGPSVLFSYKNYLCFCDTVNFYISNNGLIWSLTHTFNGTDDPTDNRVSTFFEFNGLLCLHEYGNWQFWVSSDLGVTWRALGEAIGLENGTYKVAILNGELFAVRNESTLFSVYKTTDLVNWTLVHPGSITIDGVTTFGRANFVFGVFNGLIYLGCGGILSSVYLQDMFTSPDGLTWTRVVTTNIPKGWSSTTINSALGIVVHGRETSGGVLTNNALYGIGLFPAIYDPELRCYCQLKGHLLKAKGSIQQTILNPI